MVAAAARVTEEEEALGESSGDSSEGLEESEADADATRHPSAGVFASLRSRGVRGGPFLFAPGVDRSARRWASGRSRGRVDESRAFRVSRSGGTWDLVPRGAAAAAPRSATTSLPVPVAAPAPRPPVDVKVSLAVEPAAEDAADDDDATFLDAADDGESDASTQRQAPEDEDEELPETQLQVWDLPPPVEEEEEEDDDGAFEAHKADRAARKAERARIRERKARRQERRERKRAAAAVAAPVPPADQVAVVEGLVAAARDDAQRTFLEAFLVRVRSRAVVYATVADLHRGLLFESLQARTDAAPPPPLPPPPPQRRRAPQQPRKKRKRTPATPPKNRERPRHEDDDDEDEDDSSPAASSPAASPPLPRRPRRRFCADASLIDYAGRGLDAAVEAVAARGLMYKRVEKK